MKELAIDIEKAINIEALDAELREAIGTDYRAMSKNRQGVVVYFADGAASELVRQASEVVANHDASTLTAEQEAEIAREQTLATGRNRYAEALDPTLFDSSPADVQTLAERLAWLEQEIRDLRDL